MRDVQDGVHGQIRLSELAFRIINTRVARRDTKLMNKILENLVKVILIYLKHYKRLLRPGGRKNVLKLARPFTW